jgi:hypothetical protein
MSDDRFGAFLAESFDTLRDEMPGASVEMCRRLYPREVLLVVNAEPVGVRFERHSLCILSKPSAPSLEVRTDRRTILDLVDARCTLHEAVLADRLFLCGSTADLLAFHEGLMAYLHGAMRAPSFPNLLQRYRLGTTAAADQSAAARSYSAIAERKVEAT